VLWDGVKSLIVYRAQTKNGRQMIRRESCLPTIHREILRWKIRRSARYAREEQEQNRISHAA
jgi:hypothetical protein